MSDVTDETANLRARQMRDERWADEDFDLYEYRCGPSGDGPHAHNWSDKPHRLVYDLIRLVKYERAEVARLRAAVDAVRKLCEVAQAKGRAAIPENMRIHGMVPIEEMLTATQVLAVLDAAGESIVRVDCSSAETVERVARAIVASQVGVPVESIDDHWTVDYDAARAVLAALREQQS